MSLNFQTPPKRILLVRLSAIGDILMASGLPEQLKQIWPECHVSWLCQPESASLLTDNPWVDDVIPWDRKEWQLTWSKGQIPQLVRLVSGFRKAQKNRRFDLAIDLQGLLKSAILTRWSHADYRIGLGDAEGAAFLYSKQFPRDLGNTRIIGSEYRYLAEQLGAEQSAYRMHLGIDENSRERADKLLSRQVGESEYLVFCPFTTRPQKHWFDSHWRELAERMQQRYRLPIIILGGPADRSKADLLCGSSWMQNLAGKTSLPEAGHIISKCRGLIGVDTGLTHMGHAARVPTLSLFGSTCPYIDPDNPTGKVIYLGLNCSPCRRNPTCNGQFDCLRDITPERVINEFSSLPEISR